MSFLQKSAVHLHITYQPDTWSWDLNTNFILGNCLFGAVKVTNNADPDKYGYSSYGIGCMFTIFYGQTLVEAKTLLFLALVWAHCASW